MARRTKSSRPLAAILAASILLGASLAQAQGANYENVVFGERALGMGGAAIALADEPSAVFYNPAGLARLPYDVLGISVQAYGGTGLFVQDLLRAGNDTASLDTSMFGAFPTSVAYSIPLGRMGDVRHTLALSIVAPINQGYSFSQTLNAPGAATEMTVAASLEEKELLGGISYALRAGPVSLGATVFAEYASITLDNLFVAQGTHTNGDLHSFSRTRQSSGSQLALTGVAGAHLQLNTRWSIGLRARLPNLALQSSSQHTFVETDTIEMGGANSIDHVAVGALRGIMRYPHPLGLGFGVGFRTRRLLFAFDVKGYLPMDGFAVFEAPLQAALPPARTRDWDPNVNAPASKLVVNFAAGAEVFVTEGLSLLFGLHTDASARPSGVAIDTGGASTMSFIGVSTGIRHHSTAGTFTLAVVARQGTGAVDSIAWQDGPVTGGPARIEQSSGMLTLSWTRSLTANWLELKSELDGLVGN